MELKRTNLNDKITDTINDFNDNWGMIEEEVSEKVQNFKLKNLIENGDFSDGTNGWLTFGNQFVDFQVENKTAKLTWVSGGYANLILQKNILNTTDTFYVSVEAKFNQEVDILVATTGNNIGNSQSLGKAKLTWDRYSAVLKNLNTNENRFMLGAITVEITNLEQEYRNVQLLNLTQIFGAGNEPTKEQMDGLMKVIPNGWWDGELTLEQKEVVQWLLKLESEKANKQQEAWITPTLLNGWENVSSGTPIGYYKDTLGVVHFRGALKSGVNNTEAFVLPVGYRPFTTIRSVGMASDNSVGRYDINQVGVVRPHTGSGYYVYAANVSFRGER